MKVAISDGSKVGTNLRLPNYELVKTCGLCRECKHWEYAPYLKPEWAKCSLTGVTTEMPVHTTSLARSVEHLFTHETFGCVQFEAKV